MDDKYDIRRHCIGIAFIKEELERIIAFADSQDIDCEETCELVKKAAGRGLELVQTMLVVMAEDHPEFEK